MVGWCYCLAKVSIAQKVGSRCWGCAVDSGGTEWPICSTFIIRSCSLNASSRCLNCFYCYRHGLEIYGDIAVQWEFIVSNDLEVLASPSLGKALEKGLSPRSKRSFLLIKENGREPMNKSGLMEEKKGILERKRMDTSNKKARNPWKHDKKF